MLDARELRKISQEASAIQLEKQAKWLIEDYIPLLSKRLLWRAQEGHNTYSVTLDHMFWREPTLRKLERILQNWGYSGSITPRIDSEGNKLPYTLTVMW